MSVDYDLVCHKHKEKTLLCSVGFSGPQSQCGKGMAAFTITHRNCNLSVIDEHNDDCDEYIEWEDDNYRDLVDFDGKD